MGETKERGRDGLGYVKGSGSKTDANVTCDVCGEQFTCNTTAIQHKFRKHPFHAAKHYCPQCGMQFPIKVSIETQGHISFLHNQKVQTNSSRDSSDVLGETFL